MDLILCRNVLIYFDHAVVRAVARRLWDCLAPTGWLITGPSDPSINEEGLYESVATPAGVFYRRSRRGAEVPPAPLVEGAEVPRAAVVELEPLPVGPPQEVLSAAVTARADDPLADAQAALGRGEYARAVELAGGVPDSCAAALCVRALANAYGPREAEDAASNAAGRYPLAPEIHILRAVLLLDTGRYEDAAQAVKRALYLDRTLAFGHFLLGAVLSRLGDSGGARRAFRYARELLARQGPDEIVAFSDGQRAGRFAEAVTAQLELLTGGAS
jgi:chemotaxis protein methyltransferase CheR